jgi:Skp family chaperone for outer membrane proteins
MAKLMKKYYLLTALLFVMLGASSIPAQRPANQTPAQKPAAQPTSTPVPASPTAGLPMSKMAVIYSDDFLDPKNGILKFNIVLGKLNGEFQKLKDEITQMQQRAQQLQDEINKLQAAPPGTPIDQKALQAKADQLEQLKRDIQRKGEDAQAAYNKRRTELFAPVQEEVGKALEVFAKTHGINVIIDGSQVPLIYAADSIEITRPFIADFNSKNPVTAATTPPK